MAATSAESVVWFSNSNLQWVERAFVAPVAQSALASHVIVHDIDGDLDVDVIMCLFQARSVVLQRNSGSGSFTGSVLATPLGSTSARPHATDAGPVVSTALVDVVIGHEIGIDILVNNGGGTLSFTQSIVTRAVPFVYDIKVGHINSDTAMDIVGVGQTQDLVAWWQNDGAGGFTQHTIITNLVDARALALNDIESNGSMDILACGLEEVVLLRSSGGTLPTFTRVRLAAASGRSPFAMSMFDFEGDGDLDLVVPMLGGGQVSKFVNNHDGTFGGEESFVAQSLPSYALGVDVDGDGDEDLVWAGLIDNNIRWRRNGADGSFLAGSSPSRSPFCWC